MAELDYWIWFSALRLRPAARRLLLERFGGARELFQATQGEMSALPGLSERERKALERRELDQAAQIIERCAQEGVDILTLRDPAYPERLAAIPDAPPVLYLRGRLPAVDLEPLIAVVGTRSCTPYGEKMAAKLSYGIASAGGIVVTGLAAGVDAVAAHAALRAGGRVVGVLGCPINQVYPRQHAALYADVAAAGALLSEYPPDAVCGADCFPARNRIMAGLSLGVLVVEAPARSGALITAHRALDYGRDVFAVPGNADAYASRGCLRLLKEGAALAEEAWDVLADYAPRFPGKLDRKEAQRPAPEQPDREPEAPAEPKPGEDPVWNERTVFRLRQRTKRRKALDEAAQAAKLEELTAAQLAIVAVMERERMHIDDIVDLSALPAATVASELTMLQIKGCVTQHPGKRFSLNITRPGGPSQ